MCQKNIPLYQCTIYYFIIPGPNFDKEQPMFYDIYDTIRLRVRNYSSRQRCLLLPVHEVHFFLLFSILKAFLLYNRTRTIIKQVCIPVGCVPRACCPYALQEDVCSRGGGLLPGGVSGPGGCLVPGGCLPLVPGGVYPITQWGRHPPVDRNIPGPDTHPDQKQPPWEQTPPLQ